MQLTGTNKHSSQDRLVERLQIKVLDGKFNCVLKHHFIKREDFDSRLLPK